MAVDRDGTHLAGVGIKRHDAYGAELSVVTSPAARGRGLARGLVAQAARRLLDAGALPTYLHDPANVASARVAEAAGFPDRGWTAFGISEAPAAHRSKGRDLDDGLCMDVPDEASESTPRRGVTMTSQAMPDGPRGNGAQGGSQQLVLYGTGWCPDVRRSRVLLDGAGVPYRYVDLDRDAAATKYIRNLQRGRRRVPTLVWPNGRFLVEPPDEELHAMLDKE